MIKTVGEISAILCIAFLAINLIIIKPTDFLTFFQIILQMTVKCQDLFLFYLSYNFEIFNTKYKLV